MDISWCLSFFVPVSWRRCWSLKSHDISRDEGVCMRLKYDIVLSSCIVPRLDP